MLTSTHLGSTSDVHYNNVLTLGAKLKAAANAVDNAMAAGNAAQALYTFERYAAVREALMAERGAAGLIPSGNPIPALDTRVNRLRMRFINAYLQRQGGISG